MLFRSIALAAAASTVAVAQKQYEIDAEDVSINIKNVWCENQKETCPKICEQTKPGTTLVNECDPETLKYGCLCGDNKKPNISEYSLTIPYFVCREWTNNCVTDCKSDNACASSCREDNPCGAQNPERVTSTAGSSTAAPTASETDDGTTIYTGSPGGDDEDGDSGNAAATLLGVGRAYGAAIVFGGMFAGFALL